MPGVWGSLRHLRDLCVSALSFVLVCVPAPRPSLSAPAFLLESTLAKVCQSKGLQLPLESTLVKNLGGGGYLTQVGRTTQSRVRDGAVQAEAGQVCGDERAH